jgi:AraC-like DNA-binding protein
VTRGQSSTICGRPSGARADAAWHDARTLSLSVPPIPHRLRAEHTVPAGVLLPLVELVKHWDVTSEELLGPFGLSERDVAEPQTRFSHALYVSIVERARALTGEPGIGFGWGLQMRVSTFGYLGFATMSAGTLREAIDLAIQFAALGSTAEGLRLQVEGPAASLVLDEYADFGSVPDVIAIARLTGLWRIAEAMTGRDLHGTSEVALPEPAYLARFAHLVPPMAWDRPTTRLIFDAAVLDYPLVMASPVALKLAMDQCLRELQELSAGGRLVRTVRSLLSKREGGFRSAREVADAVGMSPRTLRRRLTLVRCSLSTLLDEERRDRALLLLKEQDRSLAEVAERLGYGNVQNFERAFRRLTGMTPAAYRRGALHPGRHPS